MPKVSVIVPVYNSSHYLRRCVESIICQSVNDIEIILLDDGSDDGSYEILCDYAAQDNRIIVSSHSNRGAAATRNRGISMAAGEWITFVDSDDYVSPRYIEDMLTEALTSDSDMILSGYDYTKDGQKVRHAYPLRRYGDDGIRQMLNDTNLLTASCVWGKLFRADIIRRGVKFPEDIPVNEDLFFIGKVVTLIKSVSLIPEVNYHYEVRSDSISMYIYTFEQESRMLEYARSLHSVLEDYFDKDLFKDSIRIQDYISRVIKSLYSVDYSYRQRMKRLSTLKLYPKDFSLKNINLRNRIYYFLLINRIWVLVDIINRHFLNIKATKFKYAKEQASL